MRQALKAAFAALMTADGAKVAGAIDAMVARLAAKKAKGGWWWRWLGGRGLQHWVGLGVACMHDLCLPLPPTPHAHPACARALAPQPHARVPHLAAPDLHLHCLPTGEQLSAKEALVLRLNGQYPGDVGVLSAFFLNLVRCCCLIGSGMECWLAAEWSADW